MSKAQPPDKSRKIEEQDASLAETIDESAAEEAGSEEMISEEGSGEEQAVEEAGEETIVEAVAGDDQDAEAEAEQLEAAAVSNAANDDAVSEEADESADAAVLALGDAVRAAGENAGQAMLPQLLPNPTERRALLEAIVYIAEDPLTAEQIAAALQMPAGVIQADLDQIATESQAAERGIEIRKVAGGYKMFTKAEHHDAIRRFVKTLRPKLRLSLPALETLAVIAYKQPVTVPEIQAIRGVNAGGVIHTLLSHKLITTAGRKKVIGRPMQYKTTKEFLLQFGLNDVSELPNLKELEELSRQALGEGEEVVPAEGTQPAANSTLNGVGPEIDAEPVDLEGESIEEPQDTAEATDDQADFDGESAETEPQGAASAAVAGAGHAGSSQHNDENESDEDPDEKH